MESIFQIRYWRTALGLKPSSVSVTFRQIRGNTTPTLSPSVCLPPLLLHLLGLLSPVPLLPIQSLVCGNAWMSLSRGSLALFHPLPPHFECLFSPARPSVCASVPSLLVSAWLCGSCYPPTPPPLPNGRLCHRVESRGGLAIHCVPQVGEEVAVGWGSIRNLLVRKEGFLLVLFLYRIFTSTVEGNVSGSSRIWQFYGRGDHSRTAEDSMWWGIKK